MRRRPSTAREAQLRAELKKRQDAAAPLDAIVQGFDREFWKLVVDRLNVQLKNYVLDRQARYEKMGEVELKVAIAREVMLKEIMQMPKTCEENLATLLNEMVVIREKLRAISDARKL